jgi:hypothetical protein
VFALLTVGCSALFAGAATANLDRGTDTSATQINGNGPYSASFVGAAGGGVFFVTSEQLVAKDTDSSQDIYEGSASTAAPAALISAGHINGNGSFAATFGGVSPAGDRVFFQTLERLNGSDTDSAQDVYERSSGVTKQISLGQINGTTSDGNGPFDATFRGSSDDGTRVFFETKEQLVLADTDSTQDIYARSGGNTFLVSDVHGSLGARDFTFRAASSDSTAGSPVVFSAPSPSGHEDLFMCTGYCAAIAYDVTFRGASFTSVGNQVFLVTTHPLLSNDTDSAQDVYDYTVILVSAGQINGNGPFNAFFRGASADGNRVFFETKEALVPADSDSMRDVYERALGRNRSDDVTTPVTTSNGAFDASFRGMSSDGARVFFETSEPLAGAGDTDASRDVFMRSGKTTKRISIGQINGNGAFDSSFAGASTGGSVVFFLTSERLAPGDTDSSQDIYERLSPISGGQTRLMSGGEINGNGPLAAVFRGTDGSRVFFQTTEQLVADDTDTQQDVYSSDGTNAIRVSAG